MKFSVCNNAVCLKNMKCFIFLKKLLPIFDAFFALSRKSEMVLRKNLNSCLQVSEVDLDGRLLRVYGCGQFVDGPRVLLGDMQYVVVDDDNGAFVADSSNRRVLMMNSQPQAERVLLTVEYNEKETIHPSRMCYVPRTGQLFLVMTIPRFIAVYSIK